MECQWHQGVGTLIIDWTICTNPLGPLLGPFASIISTEIPVYRQGPIPHNNRDFSEVPRLRPLFAPLTSSIRLTQDLTAMFCIPAVATGTPGQLRSKGGKQIVEGDGYDDIVIDAH